MSFAELEFPRTLFSGVYMPNNKDIYKCLYKHLSPFTAYKKGCRCDKCLSNKRKSSRLTAKKLRQNIIYRQAQYTYNRLWFKKNKQKKRLYDKKYCKNNINKIKQRNKKYYQNNKENIKCKVKIWALNNPDKIKKRPNRYKWQKLNKDRVNALNAKRRVKINTQQKKLNKVDTQKIFNIYKQCKNISESTGIMYHVDHIIPISKGGKHHPSNLQILTALDNLKKASKLI